MEGLLSIPLFLFLIYMISRVAHFFHFTRKKLEEIDQKLEEIKNRLP